MKTTVAVTLAVLINNSFVFFSADQDRSSLSIRASGKIQSAHEVSEIINNKYIFNMKSIANIVFVFFGGGLRIELNVLELFDLLILYIRRYLTIWVYCTL